MYPVRLNLLPPPKRLFLERLVFFGFIKTLTESLIIFLACVGVLLLGGDFILQGHFNTLAANLTSVSSQQANKNRELKDINHILEQTDTIQKAYTPWVTTITHLSSLIPPGITLNQWTLDAAAKKVSFVGLAARRDDLLLFKKNLENDSMITAVDFPLSQFTDKVNVAFSITASTK